MSIVNKNILAANWAKFDIAKELGLPLGHWAITSSGPIGARGLREISDVDIIVDDQLWAELAAKYGTKRETGLLKINVPNELFDITGTATWADEASASPGSSPTIEEQIKSADIIKGLPFVNLQHTIYFKRLLGRDKDKKDIEMIEEYLKANPHQ